MIAHTPVLNERDFDRLNELVTTARRTHGALAAALEQGLTRSKPVAPTRVPKTVVTMNSRILFRDLESREEEIYTLVYPQDADVEAGKLSVLAPLGTVLLGAKVGQVVECTTPGGVRRIKVEKILYQPEAAGDLHL